MDDFDIDRIKSEKPKYANYDINSKSYMEFTIDGNDYMGRPVNETMLVFSVKPKDYLTSICYELKENANED